MAFKVGIIIDSLLHDQLMLSDIQKANILTPYGNPSDTLITGRISDVECILMPRLGHRHTINPSNVNYRANVRALHQLGASVIISATSCTSLRDDIRPGQLVFPTSVVDRTTKRETTFFDGSNSMCPGVCHVNMDSVFNEELREIFVESAIELDMKYHEGISVCVEGPRHPTRGEKDLYSSQNACVVDMTLMPESCLAKELAIPYVTTAFVMEASNAPEAISKKTFRHNCIVMKELFTYAVIKISQIDWTPEIERLKKEVCASIIGAPNRGTIPHLASVVEHRKERESSFSRISRTVKKDDKSPTRSIEDQWEMLSINSYQEDNDDKFTAVEQLLDDINFVNLQHSIDKFISFGFKIDFPNHTSEDVEDMEEVLDIIYEKCMKEPERCCLYMELCKVMVEEEKRNHYNISFTANYVLDHCQLTVIRKDKYRCLSSARVTEIEPTLGIMMYNVNAYHKGIVNTKVINMMTYALLTHTYSTMGSPVEINEEKVNLAMTMLELVGHKVSLARDFPGMDYLKQTMEHIETIIPMCSPKTRDVIQKTVTLWRNDWVEVQQE